MTDQSNGVKINRRRLIHQGLQVGAALGMAGLAGITLVGAGPVEAATTAPPINPNAPEWVPSVTPRKVRKYRWEALAAGEQARPTGLELRTIGLGVTVQDRFLNEFKRRTGHQTHGKVTTLTSMITEWLAGGWKNYDTEETNANRSSALWNAHLVQPIPVEKVIPWKYARPTFVSKKAGGYDPHSRWPLVEVWVNPDDQKEFKLVPQVYNCDSVAYRPDLLHEDIYTWGALVDPKYKGKVGILNDSLITPGWCAGWMKFNHHADIKIANNMTHKEVDTVINFLIKKKKEGQFRVIWEDYGQAVNLMASGEIALSDGWNPVVEDVKKQGVACKYAFPKEGFHAWYHGIAIRKDTPNLEAALDYVNFCLEGWWGAQVASQGYYSPVITCDAYLKATHNTDKTGKYNDYQWWYLGGSSPNPKKGWPLTGRDTGSYNMRWSHIMQWEAWPDDPDYYAKRWNDFLSA